MAAKTVKRCQSMEFMSNEFVACASRWGLTVSTRKTKGLSVGSEVDQADIVLEGGGGVLEVVPQFVYLGRIVSDDGSLDKEVSAPLAKAARVWVFALADL